MKTRFVCVITGLLLTATAAAWDPPRVEYSADMTIESAQGAIKGQIRSGVGKERRDQSMQGEKMTMILRHDKKVSWMLMPEEKMYMETKIGSGESKDDLSGYKIEQTTVGPDTVNGIATTKSKIVMTSAKSGKMGGFWWTTKEGIVVKVDAIAMDKGSKERFKMELTNLKIGKQDPALFEIPKGYSKMDMPGFGGRNLAR